VLRSRPTRACGLKSTIGVCLAFGVCVTPHAGVWIEIYVAGRVVGKATVTPHAGVWIEIVAMKLKSTIDLVTPHAGVWIEILLTNSWLVMA